MFKRVCTYIFLFFISYFGWIWFANAVTCKPPFNGNWTVPANCTYPSGGIKVYGDINVGSRTITVPTGIVLWINLGSNKVTFSSGKILFQWNSRMDNSVSRRNFITVSYSSNSGRQNCPSGWRIVNTSWNAFQWSNVSNVASSWTFRCGKL